MANVAMQLPIPWNSVPTPRMPRILCAFGRAPICAHVVWV
jgi:hypothetical protein